MPADSPFDPYEIGARNSDPELGALEPLPPAPKRMPPLRLFGLLLVGALVVAVARDGLGGAGPAAKGSCTAPAVALARTDVPQFGVIKWSAAGPSGATVVFGLDVADGVGPPAAGPDGLLGRAVLTDCAASGQFGVPAEPGMHRVTVFLVPPSGAARVLETHPLEVRPA